MIKSELIKDPCDLYIKHSVTIDLDTLEVIHQKLTNACYTEIEYRFSARRTNYTCNMVNEIRTIFFQEGISEISDLDMNCRNENYKFISIRFGKSYDYYLNIHASDSEPSDLMKELLAIIEEKNLHGYKWLTKMIVKYEKSSSNATFCQFLIGLLYLSTARRMEKPYNQFCLHSYDIFPFRFRIFFSTKNANSFQKRRAIHSEVVSHI